MLDIGSLVGKVLPQAGKIIDDLHTSKEEKMAARQKQRCIDWFNSLKDDERERVVKNTKEEME